MIFIPSHFILYFLYYFCLKELRSRKFWCAILAELLGTLVLVSAVLGASVPGPEEAAVGPLYPAAAVGVAIIALSHCFGEMSGAQVSFSGLQTALEKIILIFHLKINARKNNYLELFLKVE